ncbi:MAG TPA: hypothetical protein VH114_11240 [Candidatus Acidoferrum sp.]|jgi:hypothetical protein|nr:hypothetical protein [Candidatus Acidoferrum sp.]
MLDCQKLVRQRLSRLALDAGEKEEVHAELAAHLEEMYELARCKGMGEEQASQFVLEQVTDWKDLQHKIQNARQKENTLTPRVTRFWLPSLLTMTLAMIIPTLFAKFGLDGVKLLTLQGSAQRNYNLMVYAAWMVALPLVGALGAYLSGRAGGTQRAMVLSAVFPALAMALVILLVIPFTMFLEPGFKMVRLLRIPGMLVPFVLIPGVCLLSGVYLQGILTGRREILPAR